MFFCFLFLSLVPMLQKFLGVIYFFGDAWVSSLYVLGFAFIFFAGYTFSLDEEALPVLARLLAGAFVFAAMLSLWIALRQWLLLSGSIWFSDLPFGARPFANLAQPNNFATALCMGLSGVLYLYEKKIIGRLASSCFVVCLVFGVALTQSRTPWVSALVLVIFWGWKSRLYNLRLSLRVLLIWIGFYVLCIFLLPELNRLLLLPGGGLAERAQSLERLSLWGQFLQAILQGPPLGYGWNQVSVAQVSVSLDHPVPLMTEHSHNILLDVLLWNGLWPGFIIILVASVWLFRIAWYAKSIEGIFALLAAGFVFVHGMLEFPLEYAFFLLPVGLLLGVASGDHRSSREFNFPRWLLSGILLSCVFLFCWVWREYRVVEEDYRLMRFEVSHIGFLKAERLAPDVVWLSQLREFIRFARTEAREGMTQEELDWMRKAAHRYPYAPSLFRYALSLALNGEVQEAFVQMEVLRALYPGRRYSESVEVLKALERDHPQLSTLIYRLHQ